MTQAKMAEAEAKTAALQAELDAVREIAGTSGGDREAQLSAELENVKSQLKEAVVVAATAPEISSQVVDLRDKLRAVRTAFASVVAAVAAVSEVGG